MADSQPQVRRITKRLGGGPLEVAVKVEIPKLIQTRTNTRKFGPVTVTTKLKTVRLPRRSGAYTLTKEQAIALLERAMRHLTDLDEQLDERSNDLASQAAVAVAQAEDAEYRRQDAVIEIDRVNTYCAWLHHEAGRLVGLAQEHSHAATAERDAAEAAGARGDTAAVRRHAYKANQHDAAAVANREAADVAVALSRDLATDRVPGLWRAAEICVEEAAAHRERAKELADQAGAAEYLRGEVAFAVDQVGRRLTFARGADEGAAAALDEAALVVLAVTDLVDGFALLSTDTTARARKLALESRT